MPSAMTCTACSADTSASSLIPSTTMCPLFASSRSLRLVREGSSRSFTTYRGGRGGRGRWRRRRRGRRRGGGSDHMIVVEEGALPWLQFPPAAAAAAPAAAAAGSALPPPTPARPLWHIARQHSTPTQHAHRHSTHSTPTQRAQRAQHTHLVVDLEHRHLEDELLAARALRDGKRLGQRVGHHAGNGVAAHHGVRLARAGDAVGKDGAVDAVHAALDDGARDGGVDRLVGGRGSKDVVIHKLHRHPHLLLRPHRVAAAVPHLAVAAVALAVAAGSGRGCGRGAGEVGWGRVRWARGSSSGQAGGTAPGLPACCCRCCCRCCRRCCRADARGSSPGWRAGGAAAARWRTPRAPPPLPVRHRYSQWCTRGSHLSGLKRTATQTASLRCAFMPMYCADRPPPDSAATMASE